MKNVFFLRRKLNRLFGQPNNSSLLFIGVVSEVFLVSISTAEQFWEASGFKQR